MYCQSRGVISRGKSITNHNGGDTTTFNLKSDNTPTAQQVISKMSSSYTWENANSADTKQHIDNPKHSIDGHAWRISNIGTWHFTTDSPQYDANLLASENAS